MKEEIRSTEQFRLLSKRYSIIRMQGKRPCETGWTQWCEKKRDFEKIRFKPGDNVGIACGPASGILVLDVDDEARFREACVQHQWEMPQTQTIRTGSGGLHYYFQYPKDGMKYGNRSLKGVGFDIRGNGGCVLAPGSIHPETGKAYTVEQDTPVSPAPDWLLKLALKTSDSKQASVPVEACVNFRLDTVRVDTDTLPVDTLPISPTIKKLILEGKPKGERSEAIMKVLNALLDVGLSDHEIQDLFEEYPIGEKYREKGASRHAWLEREVEKAREYQLCATTFRPTRQAATGCEAAKATGKPVPDEGCSRPINGVSHETLTKPAFELLMDNLRQYGNQPSPKQKKALYEVLKSYTEMARNKLTGRFAFPLPTGLGKTQSIVAWLATMWKVGISHVGVAVCASKVEALCDLKRDLVAQGVPGDAIGLLHSYQFNEEDAESHLQGKGDLPPGYATLPCTDENDKKPILLVTHNRVKGGGEVGKFNLFRGRPRDLVIWDESLLISNAKAILDMEVKSAIGWLKPRVKDGETEKRQALAYLEECSRTIEDEISSQAQGNGVGTMTLPRLSPSEIARFKKALGDEFPLQSARGLLEISQEPLRVVRTQQNDGVITYDIVVPDDLKNIIILDASHPIRELVKLDKTISEAESTDNIVAYENVVVHQLRHPSGRTSMTKDFRQKKAEDRKVCREIIEVVKGIPKAEGVIIFTFKPKPGEVDFKRVLLKDMQDLGIDTEAMIAVPTWKDGKWTEEERSRFVWLTWGNETSLSKFSYCSNVIFAGVLHRSHVNIASAIVGQTDDLSVEIPDKQIRNTLRSEIGHCLYQGMARGSCRIMEGVTQDGRAKTKPMNAWLVHKDQLIGELIGKVMPGVKWGEWKPSFIESRSKQGEVITLLKEYLGSLAEDITKVSTRKVKEAIENSLQDVSDRTFTNAVRQFVCENSVEWELSGRSLERSYHYFFPEMF